MGTARHRRSLLDPIRGPGRNYGGNGASGARLLAIWPRQIGSGVMTSGRGRWKRLMQLSVQALALTLPWTVRVVVLRHLVGFKIADLARIGISLIDCDLAVAMAGARIGHFNVIRGLSELRLGPHASIGAFNWISGVRSMRGGVKFLHSPDRVPSLSLDEHASVTRFHMFDCSDAVHIGAFTIVAGNMTQILTHGIDLDAGRVQRTGGVTVGKYCLIGTRCVILKGVRVPDYSVVAAGAVVNRTWEETHRTSTAECRPDRLGP